MGERIWHDKEWKEKKRELRRKMRKWWRGKCKMEEFLRKRKEYKECCREKRREHERQEKEKIKRIRTEQEAWKYINRFRKRREGVDEEISEEKWKKHFMKTLEGKEQAIMMEEGEGGEEEEEKEEESEITKEELIKQLKKMKIGKTPEDKLENEVWKFIPKNIGEAVWKLMKKLWRKGRIPEEWKKEIICPIFKKDGKEAIRNYRGITLMDTAYKLFAGILNERLKNEIDEKLEEGQFGFRRGRGVMDME